MVPPPAGKNMPVEVKNTFIELGEQAGEDDLDTFDEEAKTVAQRQVTEPVPVNRRQLYMTPPDSVDLALRQALRRDTASEEPEGEPRRQHTSDSSDLLRQVTDGSGLDNEELAPDWGWNRFVTSASLGDNYHPAIQEVPAYGCMPQIPGWAPPDLTQYQLPLIGFAPPVAKPPEEWGEALTVMMRNLPNKFSQQMLLEDINAAGFAGTYDFLYLPIDPDTKANRGYAFINFMSPLTSWSFKCFYEGRQIGQFNSGKVVTVMPATLQGYEANYSHYSSARVSRGDVGSRPLFLREAPTKEGPPPTQRRRRGRMSLIDAAAKRMSTQAVSDTASAAGPDAGAARPARSALAAGAGSGAASSDDAAPPAEVVPPKEKRAISFCPFCGGKVCQGFKFCQFCGSALPC